MGPTISKRNNKIMLAFYLDGEVTVLSQTTLSTTSHFTLTIISSPHYPTFSISSLCWICSNPKTC